MAKDSIPIMADFTFSPYCFSMTRRRSERRPSICCSVISRMSTPGCTAPAYEPDLRAARALAQDLHCPAVHAARRLRPGTGRVLEVPGLAVEVQDRAGCRCPPISGHGVQSEHLASGVWFDPEGHTLLISGQCRTGWIQFPHAESLPSPGSGGKQHEQSTARMWLPCRENEERTSLRA